MSCQRRFTTTKSRGTTLIELMVACSIFLGMVSVLFALLLQNRRASQKASSHTDLTAQMMLVFEKVRNEMRGGRIIGLNAQGELLYWRCNMVDGMPQLTAQGKPDWLPGSPADPAVAELGVQNGVLVREFQGLRQPLAPMGKDGHLQFTWNPGVNTLGLHGGVGDKDAYDTVRNNYSTFVYEVYLTNRE